MPMPDAPAPQTSDKPKARADILAEILADDRMNPGERASLRRGDAASVLVQPAFHRLMARIGVDPGVHDAVVWACIVHAVAQTAPHGHALPTGRAFAAAGVSEARFVKLMAARGTAFRDQIALVARYLAAKQAAISWADIAALAQAENAGDDDRADRVRFKLARDYYRELHKADQKASA
jgi:CRISPR type I-E-associated protein CasB/Cse2